MKRNTRGLGRSMLARILAGAVALLTVVACTPSGGHVAPSVAGSTVIPGGGVKIGIAIDEPGISLKQGMEYSGFDITTAIYVAAKLGVPEANITWVPVDKADRETALESGEVDLVIASYSMTDERKQRVDFAGPYFVAHQDLLIRRNDDTITGPETLNGKTLCSPTGTTSAAYIKQNYRGSITLREVPTLSECVRDLAHGDVDAVTDDDAILAGFASQPEYKGILRVLERGFTNESYGVGIKKGDANLVTHVSAALKDYISSGAWSQALKTNVGPSGYDVPEPPTVTTG